MLPRISVSPRAFAALCLVGVGVVSAVPLIASTRVAQEALRAGQSAPGVDQDPAPTEAPAPKPAVTGSVRFKGEVPEAKPLRIESRQAEGCCAPGESVSGVDPSLLIDSKLGLANVVVTVTIPGVEVKLPEEPYVMDQKGCHFTPHVLVVPQGARVAYVNSDATAHNVHLIALLNDPLNQTVPAGERLVRENKEAESIKVTCDMHPWMSAWVIVTEATHWAVTAPDGSFRIEGLPAGTHEVRLWHETLGSRTASVTVAENGSAAPLALEMEPKQKKSRRSR